MKGVVEIMSVEILCGFNKLSTMHAIVYAIMDLKCYWLECNLYDFL